MDETVRYRALAETIMAVRSASVLDVGCGAGELAPYLMGSVSRYLGIELSSVAVHHAARRELSGATFAVADLNTFHTDETFDTVVFNESLYHARSPREALARFGRFVAPGGRIIVSVYEHIALRGVWADVDAELVTLSRIRTKNARGQVWEVRVLMARSPSISPANARGHAS